MYLKSELLMK